MLLSSGIFQRWSRAVVVSFRLRVLGAAPYNSMFINAPAVVLARKNNFLKY